jgi:hypothetical protein
VRQSQKRDALSFPPHPAHSPDPALCDYHRFDLVKHAQRGRHFADDNELKQSFRNVIAISRGREFCNFGIQRLTGKSVLIMTGILWENSVLIVEAV